MPYHTIYVQLHRVPVIYDLILFTFPDPLLGRPPIIYTGRVTKGGPVRLKGESVCLSVCLSVSPFGHEGCGRSLQRCEMSWRSSITSPEGDPRHWESVVSPDYPGRLHPFVAWSGRTDHVGTIAYLWYVRNVQIVGEHHRPYRQDSVIRWPNIKKEHELKVEKEEEKKKKEKKSYYNIIIINVIIIILLLFI